MKGDPKPIKLPVLVSMEDLFMMSQPPPPPKTPSPTMKIKKELGAVKHEADVDQTKEEPLKKKLRPSRPLKKRNTPLTPAESPKEERQVKLKMGAVASPEKIIETVTNHQESVNQELLDVISLKQKMIEELQEQFLLVQSENLYKSSELTDLQERLVTLEAENERLGNGGGEWDRLQEKVKTLMRDNERMKDLQIQVKKLEKENESNKNNKEVKDLDIKMKVLEKENQTLENKIRNLEKENEDHKNTKSRDNIGLENKLRVLEKENETLAKSVSSHINSAGELLRTVVSLKSRVDEVKVGESRQIKTLKRMVFNLEAEKKQLKKVIEIQRMKSKPQSHQSCDRKFKELMIERMHLFENLTEENEKVIDLENKLKKVEKNKSNNNNDEALKKLQNELDKTLKSSEGDKHVLLDFEVKVKYLEDKNRMQAINLEELNNLKLKVSALDMEKKKCEEDNKTLREDLQELSPEQQKNYLEESQNCDEPERILKAPRISLGEEEVRRLLFAPSVITVDDSEREILNEKNVEENKKDKAIEEEDRMRKDEEIPLNDVDINEAKSDDVDADMDESVLEIGVSGDKSKEEDDVEVESIENIKKLVEKNLEHAPPSSLQDFLEKITDNKVATETDDDSKSVGTNKDKSKTCSAQVSPKKDENVGVKSFELLVSSWASDMFQMGSSSTNNLKNQITKIIDADKEDKSDENVSQSVTDTNTNEDEQKKIPVSFVGDLTDPIKELKDLPVQDKITKDPEKVRPSYCDKCGIDLKESEECFEGECFKISEYTRDFLEILCDYCGAKEDHWAEACDLVTSFCEVCHCWGHLEETHVTQGDDGEDGEATGDKNIDNKKLETLQQNYNEIRTRHYASKQLPKNSKTDDGKFKFAGSLEEAKALLKCLS